MISKNDKDGDGSLDAVSAAPDLEPVADVGAMIRAALMHSSEDLTMPTHAGAMSPELYDAHVPLVSDATIAPAIDATLDLLTTATDLYDIPAFDFGHGPVGSGEA